MREKSTTRRSSKTHGGTGTPEYYIWLNMRTRCNNPSRVDYGQFGGRGITVCDAWNASFQTFLRDMGLRPTPQHQLQRIDKDKSFSPDNCLWKLRHGMKHATEYNIWCGIVQRCTNPSNTAFADYGGRGITICDQWRTSFEVFYEDVGPRPSADVTLDRLDNTKGYTKDNCVWRTMHAQTRNKRNNIWLTYQGKTQCLADWIAESNIPRSTFTRWVHEGHSLAHIFEEKGLRYSCKTK
jgi:hypothetical protein